MGPCTSKEATKKLKKRVDCNDPAAIHTLGGCTLDGKAGVKRNTYSAIQLWHLAADLGSLDAHYDLSCGYLEGVLVEKDRQKTLYHCRVAAMGGHIKARYNLGCYEMQNDNIDQAIRHWMISVMCGCDKSLEEIKVSFINEHITKDDFAKALRGHKDERITERDRYATASGNEYLGSLSGTEALHFEGVRGKR